MIDYSSITEDSGIKATEEQIARIYQRYNFAQNYSRGMDVLEVACGSGLGLGYLASVAKSVTGVDIDERNVAKANKNYKDRTAIRIDEGDAHKLDFIDESFDFVLLFEALYYLSDPDKFIAEATRVLRKNGTLMICTVNKDWEDFHPSPYAHKYFSVPGLSELLSIGFKDLRFYGGFSTEIIGVRNKAISFIKRNALKLNLIPGSLGARSHLKRVFMGKLAPLPLEIYEGMAEYEDPIEIPGDLVCKNYKIIYVVGTKK